ESGPTTAAFNRDPRSAPQPRQVLKLNSAKLDGVDQRRLLPASPTARTPRHTCRSPSVDSHLIRARSRRPSSRRADGARGPTVRGQPARSCAESRSATALDELRQPENPERRYAVSV